MTRVTSVSPGSNAEAMVRALLSRIAAATRAPDARRRLALAGTGALGLALAAAVGLAAARSGPGEVRQTAERIAAAARGDYSDAALQRVALRLDPAMQALAERHDPESAPKAQLAWGAAEFEGVPQLFQFQEVEAQEARKLNAAIPFTADPIRPAAPFVLSARSSAERERAIRCLANAVYYEAALEPIDGQRAVAQVVLNRVRDPNFPKSVCGVVYQGWERVTGCQFSFTCDGALVRGPIPVLWRQTRKVAEDALNGYVQKDVGSATHYHADYVAPYWGPTLVKITKIGAHIFYRWPGEAGMPEALVARYAGGELKYTEAILSGRAARPATRPDVVTINGETATPGVLATLPGLPGLKTVQVAQADGTVRTRVQGSFPAAAYGRRPATPDEIARINAILEARFPTKPKEAAPEAAAPAAEAPTAAPVG